MIMHLQNDGIGAQPLSAEDCEILRAQAGDGAAFAPLMTRHYPAVLAVAAKHAPAPHLADDIASEAFVFAWQNLARFRAGTDFGAWVRSIAWQLARARREREACRLRNLERIAEHSRTQAGREPDSSRAEDLLAAVATLPRERRQLVMLCDHDGCSSREAAAQLGRTSAWVRTTLHRARQQLRDALHLH